MMQSVIAGYKSRAEAEQAVRSLEANLSIQDILIADRRHPVWRKATFRRPGDETNFLILMSGEPNAIERARQLLHAGTPAKLS